MNQNSVKTKSVPLWHVCDRNTCTQSTSKGSNCGGLGIKSFPALISEERLLIEHSGTELQAAFAGPGPQPISMLVRKPSTSIVQNEVAWLSRSDTHLGTTHCLPKEKPWGGHTVAVAVRDRPASRESNH